MSDDTFLSRYQNVWASEFASEAVLLQRSLLRVDLHIHHVGSTAIPGIKSKPIVDINIESEDFPPSLETIDKLESIGYRNMGQAGVAGRYWFTKGEPRKFHLHWCPRNGEVTLAQLKFRDMLRGDSSLAGEYEQLKFEAALGQTIDSSEYANAKSAFVVKVIESIRD